MFSVASDVGFLSFFLWYFLEKWYSVMLLFFSVNGMVNLVVTRMIRGASCARGVSLLLSFYDFSLPTLSDVIVFQNWGTWLRTLKHIKVKEIVS